MSTTHPPDRWRFRVELLAYADPAERARLAWHTGRGTDSIYMYATARRMPPADVIGRLADALGVHPGDLFEQVADDSNGADDATS